MGDAEPNTSEGATAEKPAEASSAMETGLRGLEMKYMELLEKRIADLEAKLKEAGKVCRSFRPTAIRDLLTGTG